MSALEALAAELAAEGGLLAGALTGTTAGDEHLGAAAAQARDGDGAAYALLVEAIREGSLLHYGSGRVLAPDDPDLALLAGDRLYAIGLDKLAALGDVDAGRGARRCDLAGRPGAGRRGCRTSRRRLAGWGACGGRWYVA